MVILQNKVGMEVGGGEGVILIQGWELTPLSLARYVVGGTQRCSRKVVKGICLWHNPSLTKYIDLIL